MPVTPLAAIKVQELNSRAVENLNRLAGEVLQTRGGRQGSGLGSLLEALWGFMVNKELANEHPKTLIDLAWIPNMHTTTSPA